ncbi:unnamed protein product, partial [Sphacelaria rigidula]
MEDPRVYKQEERGSVCVTLVVHIDGILIGVKQKEWKTSVISSTKNSQQTSVKFRGTRVCHKRDWKGGTMYVNQTNFIDILLKWFQVADFSGIPASTSADLGSIKHGDTVVNRPYRSAVGGLMWLAGVTRADIANAARALARQCYDSCKRHWQGVLKVLAYLNRTRNYALTFTSGEMYCDADYAKKETDRRSVSGIAVMYGGVAVSSTSRTQHCVTLSTIEAESVAMAEGAKECMFVRSVLSSL